MTTEITTHSLIPLEITERPSFTRDLKHFLAIFHQGAGRVLSYLRTPAPITQPNRRYEPIKRTQTPAPRRRAVSAPAERQVTERVPPTTKSYTAYAQTLSLSARVASKATQTENFDVNDPNLVIEIIHASFYSDFVTFATAPGITIPLEAAWIPFTKPVPASVASVICDLTGLVEVSSPPVLTSSAARYMVNLYRRQRFLAEIGHFGTQEAIEHAEAAVERARREELRAVASQRLANELSVTMLTKARPVVLFGKPTK